MWGFRKLLREWLTGKNGFNNAQYVYAVYGQYRGRAYKAHGTACFIHHRYKKSASMQHSEPLNFSTVGDMEAAMGDNWKVCFFCDPERIASA